MDACNRQTHQDQALRVGGQDLRFGDTPLKGTRTGLLDPVALPKRAHQGLLPRIVLQPELVPLLPGGLINKPAPNIWI